MSTLTFCGFEELRLSKRERGPACVLDRETAHRPVHRHRESSRPVGQIPVHGHIERTRDTAHRLGVDAPAIVPRRAPSSTGCPGACRPSRRDRGRGGEARRSRRIRPSRSPAAPTEHAWLSARTRPARSLTLACRPTATTRSAWGSAGTAGVFPNRPAIGATRRHRPGPADRRQSSCRRRTAAGCRHTSR